MQIEPRTPPSFTLRPVFGQDLGPFADGTEDAAIFRPRKTKGERQSARKEAGALGRAGYVAVDPIKDLINDPGDDLAVDTAGALADAPDRPLTPERRLLCLIVRQLTHELLQAIGRDSDSGGSRRTAGHVRQVAMYVCHVAYSMPMGEVAEAFGRDRSTVGHACRMVEDRRDDAAFDGFVTIVERMASAVYLLAGRRP